MDEIKLQKELNNIFIEEFNDSFHNILTITQEEFTKNFIHRMNIILNSYYPKLIPELRKHKDFFTKSFKIILEDYYMPCLYLSEKVINKKVPLEKLTEFQRHCIKNTQAYHSCQGEFYIVKNEQKENKYVICSNCKYIYNINCILMYCPIDDCEFYSKYKLISENTLKPVTWIKYHCPIMLNQQMNCPKCQNGLFLFGKNVYCPKCKFEKDPLEIEWKCIICKKNFNTGIKEYNPLEFLSMKISVKNSLVNQLIVKPLILPCRCDNNALKLDFFHNLRCNGVLYEGNRFEKKIIVCSLCKVFASINKFMWICPICQKNFKCTNVRSFKHEINLMNEEFQLDDKKEHSFIEKKNSNKYYNSNSNNSSNNNNNNYNYNYNSNSNNSNNNKNSNNNSINNNNIIDDNLKINEEIKENEKENKKEEKEKPKVKRRKSRHLSLLLKEKEAEEHRKQLQLLIPDLKKDEKGHLIKNGKKINVNLFKPLLTDRFGGLFYNPSIKNFSPRLRKPIKRSETNQNEHVVLHSLNDRVKEFKKERQNINLINLSLSEDSFEYEEENNKEIEDNPLTKSQNLFGTNQIKKVETKKNEKNLIFDEIDYNIITQLGEGSFGKIYLVEDKEKNLFCMKKMITTNRKNFEEISKEYDVFANYKHENILTILGISKKILDESTFCIYILMEVAKTDWEKEINQRQMRNKYYSEEELINILKQIVNALAYLQKNKVSHRDVKAQNILVFPNNKYKIADFGEARKFGKRLDPLSTLRGTELYMSPILFNGLQNRIFDINHNPYKSDVFSLGMCFLFASTLRIKTLCKIRDFQNDSKLKIFIMSVVSQRYSLSFVQLITNMLQLQECDRPDFIELESILEDF